MAETNRITTSDVAAVKAEKKASAKLNKRKLGSEYEDRAAEYLLSQGMTVLERNFRTRSGEIDLIAMDGRTLVFVEVKYRRDAGKGTALEAVTYKKQQQIIWMAKQYINRYRYFEKSPIRFDVVGITGMELRHIKNAFGA